MTMKEYYGIRKVARFATKKEMMSPLAAILKLTMPILL